MLRIVADRQDAAVDARMQRLDPAIEHLGETRDLGNVAHGQARVSQCLARTAGGDEFDAEASQGTGEVDQARLIADTQQGTANGAQVHAMVLFHGVCREPAASARAPWDSSTCWRCVLES